MKLFDFAFCGGFDAKIDYLASMCVENWGHNSFKTNPVLHNYIKHTFSKLYFDYEKSDVTVKNNIIQIREEKYCVFNTGLYDANLQKIFCYFVPNTNDQSNLNWFLDGFYTEYQLSMMCINEFPLRANYFNNPEDLIFNVNFSIVPQYDHIFDDENNNQRIPETVRNSFMKRNFFDAAIENAKKRIDANYKTAVPQFYNEKIQLLIPLYLTNPIQPDLAMVVSKDYENKRYLGHTCLTMEMAYNNARLIARPDSEWLHP